MTLLELLAGILAVGALLVAALGVRRTLLQRGGATVDMSIRSPGARPGRGWTLGVGRYEADLLAWYRAFSLNPRPVRTIARRGLSIERRRKPAGQETLAVMSGSVILECETEDGDLEIALPEGSVTGFLVWLESAPPGPAGRQYRS